MPAPAAITFVEAPPHKGVGLIVGGSLLVGLLGVPFLAEGLSRSIAPSEEGAFTPEAIAVLIVPGVLAIGGGVTMIVFGARRRRAYNAWRRGEPFVNQRRGAISPFVGRTRDRTGTYGVRLQF